MANARIVSMLHAMSVICLALLLVCSPLSGVTAWAATVPERAMTPRPAAQIVVPRGEEVDTVISIGHPVIIRGSVTDSVIAFAGDVILQPGAQVAFVLDIGGRVEQSKGAVVTEGIISLGRDQPIVTTLALATALALGAYLLWVFISALVLLYTALTGMLLRRVDSEVTALARADWARLIGVGLLWTLVPLLCAAASLVLPVLWVLTLLLATLVTILAIIGLPFAANTAGRSIKRFVGWQDDRLSSIAGGLSIAIGINIPVLGLLLCVALWFYAVGIAAVILRNPRLISKERP